MVRLVYPSALCCRSSAALLISRSISSTLACNAFRQWPRVLAKFLALAFLSLNLLLFHWLTCFLFLFVCHYIYTGVCACMVIVFVLVAFFVSCCCIVSFFNASFNDRVYIPDLSTYLAHGISSNYFDCINHFVPIAGQQLESVLLSVLDIFVYFFKNVAFKSKLSFIFIFSLSLSLSHSLKLT